MEPTVYGQRSLSGVESTAQRRKYPLVTTPTSIFTLPCWLLHYSNPALLACCTTAIPPCCHAALLPCCPHQLVELDVAGPLELCYDPEWLAVLRSTHNLYSAGKPKLPKNWGDRKGECIAASLTHLPTNKCSKRVVMPAGVMVDYRSECSLSFNVSNW